MEDRNKRALLARIEGQLAALIAHPDTASRRRAWIRAALVALAALPRDEVESEYLARLNKWLASASAVGRTGYLQHSCTLARADCVLWQLRLRRRVRWHRQPVAHLRAPTKFIEAPSLL